MLPLECYLSFIEASISRSDFAGSVIKYDARTGKKGGRKEMLRGKSRTGEMKRGKKGKREEKCQPNCSCAIH